MARDDRPRCRDRHAAAQKVKPRVRKQSLTSAARRKTASARPARRRAPISAARLSVSPVPPTTGSIRSRQMVLTQPAPLDACETSGFAGGIAALAMGVSSRCRIRWRSTAASALSRQCARLFGGEQLPAHAERRKILIDTGFGKDAGDPRADRIADCAGLAAVVVSAAAQRVHVNQQRRDFRRALNVETRYTSNVDAALCSISAPGRTAAACSNR